MRIVAVACVVVIGLIGCDARTSVAEEKAAIAILVTATFGGASGEMQVEPVIVRTKYGVADWTKDGAGGRALVHKEGGQWKVVVVAGEEMRDSAFLEKSGMPQAEAKALANVLLATERQVPDARLAMLDSYGDRVAR
jgi:hypothetical protein